jgi:hypothetical protein
VDVNDFPSFRQVPDAAARVAAAVLDLADTHRPAPAWCAPPSAPPAAVAVP